VGGVGWLIGWVTWCGVSVVVAYFEDQLVRVLVYKNHPEDQDSVQV
jgi:hypothetical protein